MTHDKAREYFSAYREGALEPGLRASLERTLGTDVALRVEYEAFAATLASLDALRHEEIEIPLYLSDRIATRLESAHATKAAPFWAAWFSSREMGPRAGYALGLACALLVAAFGLRGMNASGVSPADIVPGPVDPSTWTQGPDGLVVSFAGGAAHTTTVAPEGGAPQEFALSARQPLELTLRNPNRLAKRFKIIQGGDLLATVAVPGSRPSARKPGSGTVTELASALADAYQVPVVVKSAAPGATVRWDFEGNDPRAAAEKSLEGHGSASMMDGNVLQIGQ